MKRITLVDAEKPFLNADSRPSIYSGSLEHIRLCSVFDPEYNRRVEGSRAKSRDKSNANSRRFNCQINLRPSALDSRKLAFPAFSGIPSKNLIKWREKDASSVRVILLSSLFFMFVFCGNIFADTIYLKNGSKFTGKTIRQDAEKVVFRIGLDTDGADVTFFSEQILRIDKTGASNFITLPLGQGKQIEIPRPAFNKEPLLTEQARLQSRKMQKEEKGQEANAELEEGSQTNITKQEKEQLNNSSNITESDLFLKK